MRHLPSILRIACGLFLLGAIASARADGPATASPVGRWMTIDDSTHKAKSIVSLWEKDGVLYGTIDKVFPEKGKPEHPICDKCDGALKNQPVEGMTFMWGLERDGKEWSGGRVVDPENGKIYRCYVQVVEAGSRLKVRGYVGVSLFGRTQYWQRVATEPPAVN